MGALTSALLFVLLCFKAKPSGASSWTATIPSSVKGLVGSCVVIPCSFNYPNPEKKVTGFTGIWMDHTSHVISHPDASKIVQPYKSRTELVGDVSQRNCSLKIDPFLQSDQGPFHFRIEIKDYEKYSYSGNKVSIIVTSDSHPSVSVTEEVVEGQNVSASCSVSHSCPTSPPEFSWSHAGVKHLETQQLSDGQWNMTSTLTFVSTRDDHNKALKCTVRHRGGLQREKASGVLKVKHAPVNVKVDHTSSELKQGEDVMLKCSSEAYPPANYLWLSENNTQLHQGQSYLLRNVSRHTGLLFCAATNIVGQSKSSPVHLNLLCPPEIKTISCSSEGHEVKCVCIVESRPPSTVQFVLSDRVLPSTSTDVHGIATIGTLQAASGSSESVRCVANNTLGQVSVTFALASNDKKQNVLTFFIIGAGVSAVLVLIAVGAARKCGKRHEAATVSQMSLTKEDKAAELPQTKSIAMDDDAHSPEIYSSDHVYGNTETDMDEAVYANMST